MNLYKITTSYFVTAPDNMADERLSVYFVVAVSIERAIAQLPNERIKRIEVLRDQQDGALVIIDNG